MDSVVEKYVVEILNSYRHNNLIAATVMSGVAAERAFILLCKAMRDGVRAINSAGSSQSAFNEEKVGLGQTEDPRPEFEPASQVT